MLPQLCDTTPRFLIRSVKPSGREGLWEGVVRKKVRGTQGGQNERDGLDEHSARRTSRYISYYMLLCYMSRTGNNKPYSKVPK
jgi:hypothetical protein